MTCDESHSLAPIRVVFLIGQLGLGGSERQLARLLGRFDLAALEPHVVVFNPSPHGELTSELESDGIRVWTVPPECRRVLSRLRFLIALLRRLQPDVVHSWTVHDNPYAAIAGRLAGVRVRLGSLRGSFFSAGMKRVAAPNRWLSVHAPRRIVVNSRAILQELLELGVASDDLFVLPNCIDPVDTEPPPADLSSLGIRADQRVIGMVANLRRVKNHTLFLEAMARVLPGRPDVVAAIVGQELPTEPGYPELLRRRISDLGLEGRVILAGFREDIPAVLARFEILCLTSSSESMPNVILEAMAAARPVVAVRVGGIPEMVREGDTGLLTGPDDAAALAEEIGALLDDPSRARAMGAAGRRLVERQYTCRRAVRRLEDLYRRLVAESSARATG